MNPIKPFIKKLLLAYILAVVMVLTYFLIKTLFSEDKEVALKSFNTSKEPKGTTSENRTSKDEKTQTETNRRESKTGFILLPQQ